VTKLLEYIPTKKIKKEKFLLVQKQQVCLQQKKCVSVLEDKKKPGHIQISL
jgi:hypothetical protein